MNNLSNESVRQRLKHLEDLNSRGVGTKVSSQQFEIACLRELLALREAGKEPVAFMYRDRLQKDARFSYESKIGNWSPEDISEYEITETKLYAAPQLPVADSIQRYTAANTQFGGVSLRPDGDGDYVRFADVRAMIAAAPKPEPAAKK